MTKKLFPVLGMMPAMNIPFTEDDRIDLDDIQKHIDNAIEAGISGFLIPVVASEVDKLTPAERNQIIEASLEATAGRVPVIGGASATTKEECLANVKNLLRYDLDCILANIPYTNEEQYIDYVRSVAALGPPMLMIQDFDMHGFGAPVPLLLRLHEEVDCFRCVKVETRLPGPKYTALLESTKNTLHVSGGWSLPQIIDAWDRGVHAMCNTGLHEIHCKVHELYKKGRRDKAVLLHEKMLPIVAFAHQYLDVSIHFYKRLLHRQGIYKTPKVRQPLVEYDRHFKRTGDEMLEKALGLASDIKAGIYDA